MHTGQINFLTKQLTARNLDFYDFDEDVPAGVVVGCARSGLSATDEYPTTYAGPA
jgi:hypothetical protein